MPPNTKYVGRPTKWGNPSVLTQEKDRMEAIAHYENWIRLRLKEDPHFLDELKGKDLACWCPLSKPCHVDVILKVLEEMQVAEDAQHSRAIRDEEERMEQWSESWRFTDSRGHSIFKRE